MWGTSRIFSTNSRPSKNYCITRADSIDQKFIEFEIDLIFAILTFTVLFFAHL